MECFWHLAESMLQKEEKREGRGRGEAVLRVEQSPTQYYQGVPNKIVNESIYSTGKDYTSVRDLRLKYPSLTS